MNTPLIAGKAVCKEFVQKVRLKQRCPEMQDTPALYHLMVMHLAAQPASGECPYSMVANDAHHVAAWPAGPRVGS
jgi:hypothetical protein